MAHHTVVFGPRYEGLLRDVFHGSTLPEDFSLYLHAPTVTDPSLAPPGAKPSTCCRPCRTSAARRSTGEGGARPTPTGSSPSLGAPPARTSRKHVVTRRIFTPAEFEGELNTYLGSAFSVAPKLTQSAWFRPHNRDPRIPGLYLVGAGTHPGAGLPGVINSAKATMGVIAEDLRL